MKKFQKLGGVLISALCLVSVPAAHCEAPATSAQHLKEQALSKSTISGFSDEQIEGLKTYITEEFNKLYDQKKSEEISQEVIKLRQEVSKQKRRAEKYKTLLHAKKDYLSPAEAEGQVSKAKIEMLQAFNKYMVEYVNKSENKDKKLKQVDLTNLFHKFINLNFTFNNPNDVTIGELAPTINVAGAKVG